MSTQKELNKQLVEAAEYGNERAVRSLLAEGANVNARKKARSSEGGVDWMLVVMWACWAYALTLSAVERGSWWVALSALGCALFAVLCAPPVAGRYAVWPGRLTCVLMGLAMTVGLIRNVVSMARDIWEMGFSWKALLTALLTAPIVALAAAAVGVLVLCFCFAMRSISDEGKTALMLAAGGGHADAARALAEAGANLEAKKRFGGRTALMFAAAGGHTAAALALVEAGANLEAKNWFGRTALMLAEREGRTETALALEAAAHKRGEQPETGRD